MSEEKKAIEILKEIKDVRGIRQDVEGENEDLWALGIVYNLIDKQQKEIEELKAINQIQKYRIEVIDERELISKDKIRERKKWYEDTCKHLSKNGIDLDKYDQYQGAIEFCEELLEEN